MITDKEINQVADDEKQKDWNDLKYADIYKDGFIDGAKWMQMRAGQVKPEVKPACEHNFQALRRDYYRPASGQNKSYSEYCCTKCGETKETITTYLYDNSDRVSITNG